MPKPREAAASYRPVPRILPRLVMKAVLQELATAWRSVIRPVAPEG